MQKLHLQRAGATCTLPRGAAAVVAALSFALFTRAAFAADVAVVQTGTSGDVQVEQANSTGSARITQHGSDNRADISQLGVTAGRITVDQSGAFNQLDVWQSQGGGDAVEVMQAGASNQARLVQSGLGGGVTGNLAVLRQLGVAGDIGLVQAGRGATAAVLQSALSSGDRANVYQAASAPLGVIEQGVALADNRRTLDIAAEAVAVRQGGPFTTAASAQSTATLLQIGGAGLAGIVVQSGAGQLAVLSQAGSYLEAEILQGGGAHAAVVAQVGAGTASSPYRASITQLGAQPQSFSVQQQAGSSPRSIRVIQR